jgi:CDP-4-dehydro-6-deoxyglucose reductase
MMDWIQEAQKRLPNLHFVPVLSEPSPSSQWTGRTGFVHLAALEDHPDMRHMEVYACGAPIVIESAKRDFTQQAHLSEDAFYADAFTSEADKEPLP